MSLKVNSGGTVDFIYKSSDKPSKEELEKAKKNIAEGYYEYELNKVKHKYEYKIRELNIKILELENKLNKKPLSPFWILFFWVCAISLIYIAYYFILK